MASLELPEPLALQSPLPEELLVTIFSLVGPRQCLSQLSLVCRGWRYVSKKPPLWHLFCTILLVDAPRVCPWPSWRTFYEHLLSAHLVTTLASSSRGDPLAESLPRFRFLQGVSLPKLIDPLQSFQVATISYGPLLLQLVEFLELDHLPQLQTLCMRYAVRLASNLQQLQRLECAASSLLLPLAQALLELVARPSSATSAVTQAHLSLRELLAVNLERYPCLSTLHILPWLATIFALDFERDDGYALRLDVAFLRVHLPLEHFAEPASQAVPLLNGIARDLLALQRTVDDYATRLDAAIATYLLFDLYSHLLTETKQLNAELTTLLAQSPAPQLGTGHGDTIHFLARSLKALWCRPEFAKKRLTQYFRTGAYANLTDEDLARTMARYPVELYY